MTVRTFVPAPTATTGPERGPVLRPGPAGVLTRWLALVSAISAGSSLFFPSLLDGVAVTDGNLRGTALVVLVVAVPVLLAASSTAQRGSVRGLVVWLGAVAYLTYQGVMFCFGTPMNSLFLGYVAVLGLGFWTLLSLLAAVDPAAVAARVDAAMPYRSVGAVLAVFAGLNALAWLARVVPPAFSGDPSSPMEGTGLLTSPVYVQDLALWIPAALLAARWMWLRRPWGALLTPAVLAFYVLECVSVASDQWWGVMADASQPAVASMAVVPAALVVAVVAAVPLGWSLRHLDRR